MERELFSFFASFFLFSKEKKKRNSLRNHLYTKDDKQINLQTPYLRNLTTCTRKHLNINTTDTGKGNNRRWQAPGGQRGASELRRTVSTQLPQKVHFTKKSLPVRHTPRIFTRLPRQNDKKVQHPLALPAVLCYTIKAIPHKERLATLHAICLQISLQSLFRIFPHASCVHIFRDISGKHSKIHKGFSPFFPSSLKKSDDAICIRQIRSRLSYFTKMLVNTSSIHSAFCFI
ncbi:MAG: hypothetical protein ACLR1R_13490 [Ruminococcus callidus]